MNELPKCTIYEYMKEKNKNNLDSIALEYFERKITYKELFDNIEYTARAFSALGVNGGDVVVAVTINTPETIYMLYALNMIGAALNMVDPRTSVDGIRDCIKEVNAKYVVALEQAYYKAEKAAKETKVEKIVVVSPADSLTRIKKVFYQLTNRSVKGSIMCMRWGDFMDRGKQSFARFNSYTEKACCVIVHPGDTASFHKGIMLSNDDLNMAISQSSDAPMLAVEHDNYMEVAPSFDAYGVILEIHAAICAGLHSVIMGKIDSRTLETMVS